MEAVITEEQVKALLELEAKATPGDWVIDCETDLGPVFIQRTQLQYRGNINNLSDVNLIATSRNQIKNLCEDWLRLQKENAEIARKSADFVSLFILPDCCKGIDESVPQREVNAMLKEISEKLLERDVLRGKSE